MTTSIPNVTPAMALEAPLYILAQEHAEVLFAMKEMAAITLRQAKRLNDHIEQAIDMKYSRQAHQLRLAGGKDTGVIHFVDDTVQITADLPKKVDWDQKKLSQIVERIRQSGQDASEYVNVKYEVSESKYKAWPSAFRTAFDDARTLKTGKPSYRLALMEAGS